MKRASLLNKRNSTNVNAQKLKKTQRELTNTYQKEQEFIQGQINKTRNSVEDKTITISMAEVSGRKNTSSAKLKASSQEERIQKWKKHFTNRNGNPPEVTDKPIKKLL